MIYASIAPWQTGDVASATKLNQMNDNVSYVAGLHDQRRYPFDSGADKVVGYYGDGSPKLRRPTNPWEKGKVWDGWICHNGDRLIVYADIDDVGNPVGLTYDYGGDNAVHYPLVSGVNTLILDSNYVQYQPVRIYITTVFLADPGQAGGYEDSLWIRYIYQTNSNVPEWATLPTFAAGVSAASDFNAIVDACEEARVTLEQPVASAFYWRDSPAVQQGWYCYLQRLHSQFSADLVITSAKIGDYAYININGTNAWGYTFSAEPWYFDQGVPITADLATYGVNVGDWYQVQFGYNYTGIDPGNPPCTHLWSAGETAPARFGTQTPYTKWAQGNTLSTASLVTMSNNLIGINGVRRWQQVPCRHAYPRVLSPEGVQGHYTAYRIYRWLAYENRTNEDGTRETAQIEWNTNGRNLQSYSLPTVDQPYFFDLESTPIKPGMYMRISGCKFAIQAPLGVDGLYV